MKTWTVDEMMSHGLCEAYSRERLESLWAGRPELNARDIAALEIAIEDRIWALLTDDPHVAPAVERIVRRAVKRHALHCGMPAVEQWAARWISEEDRSRAAAWAAWEAAAIATWAASAESRAAAEADAEAWAEALAAERERQLADILAVLDEQETEQQ